MSTEEEKNRTINAEKLITWVRENEQSDAVGYFELLEFIRKELNETKEEFYK